MKGLLIFFVLLALVLGQNFDNYVSNHNKRYGNGNERAYRHQLYQKTWMMINQANTQNLGYKLGENMFTDRTEEEAKGIP
jgi:hypothetical protein